MVREGHCVFTVALKPQAERLQAEKQAPRVERAHTAPEVTKALDTAADCLQSQATSQSFPQ